MTITELRDKYQNLYDKIGRFISYSEAHTYKNIISDLNALIQSEDKERRELLEKYTVYLNKTNRLKNLYVEPFDLIDSFLESEKGGEG